MVIDVITYNGELDVLKLRLAILYDSVDKFIICEAKTTFSGTYKPLYFSLHEKQLMPWWPKIDFFVIDEDYTREELILAESSPNTQGASHWKREFLQKESLKKALEKYNDTDMVYIGDCDEVWDARYHPTSALEKLKLRVYAYQLNNRSTEEFWGTLVGEWGLIKTQCLNHLRSSTLFRGTDYGGWHFTNMGGFKQVQRKLNDSYTPQSYNTVEVQQALKQRMQANTDYLGRGFTFTQDELDWPPYLQENKDIYKPFTL